jgi:Spy/CpxP family protein refolding chaperone
MKRIRIFPLLACAAVLLLGATAQAQTASPDLSSTAAPTASASPSCSPGPWAGHRNGKGGKGGGILEHLTNTLGLSGSQQAEIAPILQAAKPQMKAIRDQAMAARKSLIESTASQISPLLTSDQQAKFSEMVQKAEAGPGPGRLGHRHGPKAPDAANAVDSANASASPGAHGNMLDHLTTQLGLTADQQAQIKPILDAAHTQVQAIHNDTSIPQDQKFAKIKETMEAAHSQINGILTPAQQQQLATMRGNFHRRPVAPSPSATPEATPTPAAN